MHGFSPETTYAAAAFLWAGIGALCDVRSRRIPNWLTGSGMVAGLLLHLALGGWRSLGSAALGGLIAGAIFLAFYISGGLGAGDVKLMVAVCCFAGVHAIAGILVGTALIGGVLRHRAGAGSSPSERDLRQRCPPDGPPRPRRATPSS